MNQTAWIVSGGALVVIIAGVLYFMSGDGLPKTSDATPVTLSPAVTITTDASSSPVIPPAPNAPKLTPIKDTSNTPMQQPTTPNSTPTATRPAPTPTSEVLHTSMGNITVKLYAADAPKTVENFTKLAASGFYDGVKFHRVIEGFMIQAGDPKSKDDSLMAQWGTGGPGYQFADEINPSSDLYKRGYVHGVVAMANSGPDTNGSQFFIMAANYKLPPQYTIFGEVTSGLDVVDAIDAVATNKSDRPLEPIVIKTISAP